MKANKILALLFILLPFFVLSQISEIKIIKENIDRKRNGSSLLNDFKTDSTNEKEILQFIRKYETDTNKSVRFYVDISKLEIAYKTNNRFIRQEIVESFFLYPTNIDYIASKILELFNEEDFSPKSKKLLQKQLLQSPNDPDIIMLCGMANVKDVMPQLRKVVAQYQFSRNKRNNGWCAMLALTRLGDDAYVDKIISTVELELDEVIKGTRLFKYLAFTKHPDCIKLLYTYIIGDERMPDLDGVRGKGEFYSQRAILYLSRYMDNFPIKEKYYGYSMSDLEIAKTYLSKYLGL